VSRRAVLEAKPRPKSAQAALDNLQEGAVVKGIVKNITDYGAFVDLGGIDGLLHITDMAWRRVKHPSEVLSRSATKSPPRSSSSTSEKNRVSLGLKQLGADPWVGIRAATRRARACSARSPTSPTTARSSKIEQGIEGLVHVSEMDWTNKNVIRPRSCTLGDEVEVMVLEIDEERRRISLGMKQCKANPWEGVSREPQPGDKVAGRSSRSPTSASSSACPAASTAWCTCPTCPGRARRRSGAQLQEGPRGRGDGAGDRRPSASASRSASSSSPRIRSPATSPTTRRAASSRARSSEVDARGAIIDLGNGIEGQLRASELGRDRIEDARQVLKVGDEVEAKFVGVDGRRSSYGGAWHDQV
jgi:small subunit ribosomal protein S1